MPVPLANPGAAPALGDLAGIQIIGAPRDDLGVLQLAAAYEAALAG
jgi:Asp-tRNA(Asn)/Glu-tRNA(Gln) amidotransferase A subunit family amidase